MNGLTVKKARLGAQKTDWKFYWIMMAFPLAQFLIFYVAVNLNSVLLAFKEYELDTGNYRLVWFDNFSRLFSNFRTDPMLLYSIKNSLISYAVGLVVGVPLAVLFAFYIYKKMALSRFFKVLLFLPSIISAIIMVVICKYLYERAVPALVKILFGKQVPGLLEDPDTAFGSILVYNVFVGFGTTVLMYRGAMAEISDSVVESARLEGAGTMREFWHITLPLIYPTVTTFLVVGVAGIFTNQMNLFSFYGDGADSGLYTFGYFLFRKTAAASVSEYPYLSSLGVLLTCVAMPLTLAVKKGLERFTPTA